MNANPKETAMQIVMMILSDLYRLIAALFDWRGHLRAIRGLPAYDVACIANFETPWQMPFMGLGSRRVSNGLRFSLHGKLGRYLLIRSSAKDLEKPAGRLVAKLQAMDAIEKAAGDGARIILFAAGTKRLFTSEELESIRSRHPELVFTIGDHGTAWALMQDVLCSIERNRVAKQARIMVIGPNGFLGSQVKDALNRAGYHNLALVSHRTDNPFDKERDVELIVACSHHRRVRLTAETLDRIAHPRGVHVVDVCKPTNLSRRQHKSCPETVTRQDAGNTYNPHLKYVFSPGARFVLATLKLSLHRLYGCFSEAIAIASSPVTLLKKHDFVSINEPAMAYIKKIFPELGFEASPICSFGTPVTTPVCLATKSTANPLPQNI
jgi:hypothetical protein